MSIQPPPIEPIFCTEHVEFILVDTPPEEARYPSRDAAIEAALPHIARLLVEAECKKPQENAA